MISNHRSPRVIILGGWSPGPTLYLKQVLSSTRCVIIELQNLPMPPIPGSWCYNPTVLLCFAVLAGNLYNLTLPDPLLISHHLPIPIWVKRVVILVATFLWIRLLASVVVRTSIEMSIRLAQSEIVGQDDPHDVLLIGFSWGGSVRLLAGLCCNGVWKLVSRTQADTLLLRRAFGTISYRLWRK